MCIVSTSSEELLLENTKSDKNNFIKKKKHILLEIYVIKKNLISQIILGCSD